MTEVIRGMPKWIGVEDQTLFGANSLNLGHPEFIRRFHNTLVNV